MPLERKCRIGVLALVSILLVGFYGAGVLGEVDSRPPAPTWVVPCFELPEKAELCGEAVPLGSADVRERFDREFTIVTQSHAQVYLWLKRIERYFPWIEKQLTARGLPDDLKYVTVAESDLMTSAVSHSGAVGPWQFMANTAACYGIAQSSLVDERYDQEKSATAAFGYLKDLHDLFQNWTLAVAAYNCGEKRIQAEIGKQNVNSYYLLKLPLETERYVFRILAIKEVLENPGKYGYHLPKGAGYQPILFERVTLNLPGPMPIAAAAQTAGVTYRELKMLNPCLVSDVIPTGGLTIRVPEGSAKRFEKGVEVWKSEYKPIVLVHKVARGETLGSIAAKYNLTKQQICGWNNIAGDKIRIGQKLKLYR
ncbi:MAG TPA: transglycosylase SLT domain-containing protein [Syntrophobacteraceae bacterium]|nr:transglycosylase SLT domain-containing protein [Syntrophobacteraceae bacterium]